MYLMYDTYEDLCYSPTVMIIPGNSIEASFSTSIMESVSSNYCGSTNQPTDQKRVVSGIFAPGGNILEAAPQLCSAEVAMLTPYYCSPVLSNHTCHVPGLRVCDRAVALL